MLISIVVAASLLMLAGIFSFVQAWVFPSSGASPKNWRKLFYWTIAGGLLLALLSWLATFWMLYPYPNVLGEGWFAGMPFMAVYIDANQNNYHFNFTQVSVIANACFWFLMPVTILYLYGLQWRRLRTTA
jgi:magnesium-transporting ATPase (P-type)